MSVGSKQMAPAEVVQDLHRTLGYSVNNVVDIALDNRSTEKMTAFALGTGVKIVDERVDVTRAEIGQLVRNTASAFQVLQEQARIIKEQADTIETLKRHIENPQPATGTSGSSRDAAALHALAQEVQALRARVTPLEVTVNNALLVGDQQGQSEVSLAANLKSIHDKEREEFKARFHEILCGCHHDHDTLKASLNSHIAV
ncbi:hypothetical protein QBC41DRAFT_329263 [Cercophora samala]|uniref:Uncharacterized protein n=1 Tax=Cercophora samala TaxID=330535 RepID=A0AA39Z3G1_9PEZI|nr:hypothetical protein QBC41DRAFT_329263 [Cercophora samala]